MLSVTKRCGMFLTLAFLVVSINGQIAGGLGETTRTDLGGNNYIAGTVFSPAGSPIQTRMRVKLVSMTRGEIVTTTDDRGQFIFSGVGAGEYTVAIDREKDFEPVSQTVSITRARSTVPETYNVSLRLTAKVSREAKPAVIYAEDANASKKAVELFRDAIGRSKLGDHRGAVEKLRAAIAESPRFISALNELGVQYIILGEFYTFQHSGIRSLEFT